MWGVEPQEQNRRHTTCKHASRHRATWLASAHDSGRAHVALALRRYWHLCNCRLGLRYVGLRTADAVPREVGGKGGRLVYGPSDDPGMQRRRAARHVSL